MNPSFARFLSLPAVERRDLFDDTADRMDTVPAYVEKDFWVCLVIDALYHGLPAGHPQFLFKGGTALAKTFGLIRRFSEDIDIVVSRAGLGFIGDRDPTNHESDLSNKKRSKLFEELRTSCSAYIQHDLRRALGESLRTAGADDIIHIDENDQDGQTLLIAYPNLFADIDDSPYVEPVVKIEGGARSGLEHYVEQGISPFVAEQLTDLSFRTDGITTIHPARAFWEKLHILHGLHCGYRDQRRLPQDHHRISRHYYDAAMIASTNIGKECVRDLGVARAAREHTLLAFRQAWKKVEEAVPGSLRLVPQPEVLDVIERDYASMRRMIFGDAPDLDWIIQHLQVTEVTFNSLADLEDTSISAF